MSKEAEERRKKIICELMEDKLYVPMKEKELASFLQVHPEERPELSRILEELVSEGRLTRTARGKFVKGSGKAAAPTIGIFIANARGFGFVEIEGMEEDLYIPPDMANGAFHKDKVEVSLLPANGGKRQEAKVVRILERGLSQLVGTYEKSGNFGFVRPDNTRIPRDVFVPIERSKGAVTGHKVVVELTDYGKGDKNPEGKVVDILGHVGDPGMDILSIVKAYELEVEFPEKVLTQAERIAKPVSEADRDGRRDLRDTVMVTIDGEDAKDLDDAVSLSYEEETGLYHLGVHIADVCNYVQENSALDKEALKRGTSVYLTDRVIPMLPHILSNGICSLNAGEDRLALSCLMDIDKTGEITDYEIVESVINVDERMSYTSVKKILEDRDEAETEKYRGLVPMFEHMRDLSALLRERRKKRGAIDFDFPESKIELDESGHPIAIHPYERNTANMLIEDFMLAANETVAQHFYWMEAPFVYRVHERPDAEKLQKLNIFINNLGYYMKSVGRTHRKIGDEEVHPKEIQKLLSRITGTPEEAMISRLTLRSMKQARYSTESSGHFGLACQYYCHFTSPIRRYPDLQIHRIIKDWLRGRLGEERMAHYRSILDQVAKRSSERERLADEAERETDKLKKVEYMEERIGQEYVGVISGITAWGIYVELPNTVEGMIHVSKLPGDYFFYNENTYEMQGERTGIVYRLGEALRIRVAGADRFLKTIDFDLVEDFKDEQGNAAEIGSE
ncbi:MAG: ribonuclease R [Lachnospiraceae bacterium]|nr:ribonuclease R [Lachnospiraceae bacterium]